MTDSLELWLSSFISGKKWLQNINSPDTKRVYIASLNKYCKATEKTPDDLIAVKIEGLQNINTPKEFQAEDLLENYLCEAKLTDSIKEQIKASVLSFYKNNKRQLNNQTAKNIGKPTPKQRTPICKDLEKLESVFTCQRDRALIWFLASSGVRVGTLFLLKWQDLQETENKDVPYKIIIEAERLKGKGKGRYQGLKQITFLHSLAASKLEEYKIEAKNKGYELKPTDPIFIKYSNQGKIQSMKPSSMDSTFTDASLTIWHDLEKKRFSPHDIRDFTQSALESSGANSNVISPILAHKIRGVDKHYSAHFEEELLQVFKHALPWLLPETVEKLKAESVETKAETKALKERMAKYEEFIRNSGTDPNTIKKMIFDAIVEYERQKPEKVKIEG